ncbi:AAA family ATPase [Amycolatopsis suaedae]|uniref:Helix-turn-helix transcriptional regulator n=1 Tax=Amycolatopsis suaedae TaxID=2510978 RepID=A0A4Q7IYW4_9PSEU|nr:LuxR family transcriptional regulator [Amycolatopsis suaedae]RZQ60190.1 helix-turn-helix transcriptional regulator [Amycolatopsis suaedae]
MLLERESELALLAAAGSGSALAITGPPGIGRSALLGTLADADAWVLRADCTVLERDYQLGVVSQLCGPLLAGLGESRLRHYFRGPAAPLRDLDSPGTPAAETVLAGLSALLGHLGEDRPVRVLVDDLQWADRLSLTALGFLAKRLTGTPVLLACTVTEGVPCADSTLLQDVLAAARHVRPGPLSVDAVGALLGDGSAELAATCHRITGGNPAAVLTVADGLAGVEPAGDIQRLLTGHRLSTLATQHEHAGELARAMAVLGAAPAEPALLAELAGLDEIEFKSALHTLDGLGLLAPGGPPRFAYAGLADAIAATLPVAERGRLHGRAALLLHEAGAGATEVADQLVALTSVTEEWQVDVLRLAAGAALDSGDPEAATRYLRCALLSCPHGGTRRARLLVDLAAAERGLDLGAAVSHVSQALLETESPDDRVDAVLRIPPALARTVPALGDLVRSAAGRAGPVTGSRALRLEARLRALDIHRATRLTDAVHRLGELEAGGLPLADPAGRELVSVLVFAAAVGGSLPAAEVARLGAEVLEYEPGAPDNAYTAMPLLVPALVAADALDDLLPWLRHTWTAAERRPYPGERASAAASLAAALHAAGRSAEAVNLAATAQEQAGESWPEVTLLAARTRAAVALSTQDTELADAVLAAIRDCADPRAALLDRMLRGLLDAVRGDLASAVDRFLDCGQRLARWGWINPALYPWRPWAAALLHRQGEREASLSLARAELDDARAWGAPAAHGKALCLLGMLTDGEEGTGLLRAARRTLAGSADRLEYARAGILLARRLPGTGEAGEIRAEADAVAADLDCRWAEVETELCGPVLEVSRSGRAGLSKAEDGVVDLVVRGWTNQRIADELGVTRRAVEKNLTSAYRKLAVSGRRELVAKLGARH